MLLNTLQGTKEPPTKKNYPAQMLIMLKLRNANESKNKYQADKRTNFFNYLSKNINFSLILKRLSPRGKT